MSRELYDKLFGDGPVELEDGEQVSPLLLELARAAQLRRAAEELAQAELDEGFWVDEQELPEQQVRLAAEDLPDGVQVWTYTGGAYRLRLTRDGGRWSVSQEAGPAGITLVIGEAWVPVQPGRATVLDSAVVAAMGGAQPESIELMDASGRRLRVALRG